MILCLVQYEFNFIISIDYHINLIRFFNLIIYSIIVFPDDEIHHSSISCSWSGMTLRMIVC